MGGSKKHGYTCAASCVTNPPVWLGKIILFSLLVLDDGHWREINVDMFNATSAMHFCGQKNKLPISKFDGELRV